MAAGQHATGRYEALKQQHFALTALLFDNLVPHADPYSGVNALGALDGPAERRKLG